MIKSLYIRVVLTFLVSIIGGTIIAYFVTTWVFENKLNDNLQVTLLDFGHDIVRIYERFPSNEVDTFISGMKQLNSYYIRIYEETGQFKAFGSPEDNDKPTITLEQINMVLNGATVEVKTKLTNPVLLGLPLKTDTGSKALFVGYRPPSSASFIIKWIISFLVYSLVAGSLLNVIAALFLVRPIKKLTEATKKIAAGNFDVKLNIKQKGELGMLARSFEDMMHDLGQIEQMRRDFVSNVSHEVQSPLTSISGYAKALQQVNIGEQEKSRYIEIIIAEAERMSNMSDGLLKLSMLESQTQQLQYETFSLDEQIRRVIVALQPQWAARNIQFELNLKAVHLTADRDLLNQVWTNILSNSIKFSKDGGVIEVGIKQDVKNVTLRISDSGIGISPEDQKRIFERFFKADRSHSRKFTGSGMGLAIVKQIVSLHLGDIHVESELGRGTTFIITLPIVNPTE